MRKIADLYAEVIGVLSQARFHSVRRRFFLEIRNQSHSSATIIAIIEGMSFIRVKMFPVEELEQWFAFLQVSHCPLFPRTVPTPLPHPGVCPVFPGLPKGEDQGSNELPPGGGAAPCGSCH